MAHRGKVYPLTFRRDFNINVSTYQAGLAETYRLDTGTFMFTDWPGLRNTTWFCGPATDSVLPRLIWSSDVRTIAGHDWQFRCVGTLSGPGLQFWDAAWYLSQDGIDACAWQMVEGSTRAYFPDNGVLGRLIFFDGSIFPSGPGSIGLVGIAPVPYP